MPCASIGGRGLPRLAGDGRHAESQPARRRRRDLVAASHGASRRDASDDRAPARRPGPHGRSPSHSAGTEPPRAAARQLETADPSSAPCSRRPASSAAAEPASPWRANGRRSRSAARRRDRAGQRRRRRAPVGEGPGADGDPTAPRARRRGAGGRCRRARTGSSSTSAASTRRRSPPSSAHWPSERPRTRADRSRVPIELVAPPRSYIAGEESAAVHFVNEGDATPDHEAAATVRARRGRPPDARPERREPRARRADRAVRRPRGFAKPGAARRGARRSLTINGRAAVGRRRGRDRDDAGRGRRDRRRPGHGGGPVMLGGYFGGWVAGADAWNAPLDPIELRRSRVRVRLRCRGVPRRHGRAACTRQPGSLTSWPARAPPSAGRACSASARSPTRRRALRPARRGTATSAASRAGRGPLPVAGHAVIRTGRWACCRARCAIFDSDFAAATSATRRCTRRPASLDGRLMAAQPHGRGVPSPSSCSRSIGSCATATAAAPSCCPR